MNGPVGVLGEAETVYELQLGTLVFISAEATAVDYVACHQLIES